MLYKRQPYRKLDLVTLPIRSAPVQSLLLLFERVLTALSQAVSILATARFIDVAIKIAGGELAASAAIGPIAVIIAVLIYTRLIGSLVNLLRTSMENRLRRVARGEMLHLRAQLKYSHIENTDDQDLIGRVCPECDTKLMSMFDAVLNLTGLAVQLLGYAGILLVNVWWSVIAIAVFCVPLILVGLRSGKENYEAGREVTSKERLYTYLSQVMTGRDTVEERYMFGFAPHLNRMFESAYESARLFKKKVEKKNFIRMKATGILMSAATLAMGAVLIYPTIQGQLTVGLFMSLISALSGLVNVISWSLNYNLSELSRGGEYLNDLSKFMALGRVHDADDLPTRPPLPFETLEFRHVTFRYPGGDADVLKDMSFTLERGRHYAIVGANGSGKTTLTKLITGLYDNYEGEILLNGKSIGAYSSAELKSLSAVVYQDFARYFISVHDNIAVGDVCAPNDRARARRAAEALDLDRVIAALPSDYDTELGKLSDKGVDLSGGEWQRLALARALYSPAPLKILDEPTAALDPVSESRVYRHFEKISRGNSTVFISHRLGSTKLADTILVVADGKIAEQGTHADLMDMGGTYAKMYLAQAEWYKDAEDVAV